jgi:hypothetical protein
VIIESFAAAEPAVKIERWASSIGTALPFWIAGYSSKR